MASWKLLITNLVLFFTTTCLCTNDLYEKEQVPLDLDNVLRVELHTEPEYQSKVDMSINPGCSINNCTLVSGKKVSVINVTVHDDPVQDDEQHWLWSVIGRPTVQAAITPPDDRATMDWSSILSMDKDNFSNSISYTKEPFYSGAVMLMNLIEFEYPNETAGISNNPTKAAIFPIVNFHWDREIIENTDDRIAIRFMGTNYTSKSSLLNDTWIKGEINLTISAYANFGFGRWLPHLSHSSKTSQVDIQLQRLESSSGFNNSRYALELFIVSSSAKNTDVKWHTSTTLDDEHTPGIFRTQELILPGNSTNYQSYLQWRPVVYTTPSRDLSESTGINVSQSLGIDHLDDTLKKSLLYALYGDDLNDHLVRRVNITFGSGEKFYKKTKYQAWTFTFGVGEPIQNSLSPIIILVITAMLGILVVAFIIAGIVYIVKTWKKRTAQNYANLSS